MKKLFNEFKNFCSKGNILELATGVMIGGAFSSIVTSLVNDMLMPVIGLLTGGVDLSGLFIPLDFQFDQYATIDAAKAAGVGTLNYGAFLQAIFNFLIIAFCIFMLVKAMAKLMPKKEEEPKKEDRKCPYCKMVIDDEAVKCPHCASELPVAETAEA
ncbi:MAG: large conductance mechanosensitive channel protein MscL [Clostridiales bacterium]|nr:large conductance mechanosensitive channel protein MscL [Clostridiales bacterium]